MTSQNNTLRCAASTIYSMAGPNTPSGAVNAPTDDWRAWLDGIGSAPCLLLSRREKGNTPVARSCARWQHTPSRPTVFFLRRTHEWQAFGAASHSPRPRSLRLDLCQVPGKAHRRIVRPYRRIFPGPRPNSLGRDLNGQPHFSVMPTSPGNPPGYSTISTLSLYPRGRKYFAQ